MVIVVVLDVLVVILVVAWSGLRRGGPDDPAELDPRTARRQMDKQFKKPPNEGGLL